MFKSIPALVASVAAFAFSPVMTLAETPSHVATKPADRLNQDWWKQRFESKKSLSEKGGIEVAFIGDSITQGWEGGGKKAWESSIAPLKAGNYGYGGDRTEHVLWRLEHEELKGIQPKVIVLMIGTNNIGHKSSTPAQTIEGIQAILAKLNALFPEAKVILHGVFPRGATPNDEFRQKVVEINAGLPALADGKKVHFLDIGQKFLEEDGSLSKEIMPDLLHLNEKSYQIWADAVVPKIQELLK